MKTVILIFFLFLLGMTSYAYYLRQRSEFDVAEMIDTINNSNYQLTISNGNIGAAVKKFDNKYYVVKNLGDNQFTYFYIDKDKIYMKSEDFNTGYSDKVWFENKIAYIPIIYTGEIGSIGENYNLINYTVSEEVLDGKNVYLVRLDSLDSDYEDITIWIDIKTKFPVRILDYSGQLLDLKYQTDFHIDADEVILPENEAVLTLNDFDDNYYTELVKDLRLSGKDDEYILEYLLLSEIDEEKAMEYMVLAK